MYVCPSVAKAAVRSKVVVLLLLIYCFMNLSLFMGSLYWSLFWYVLLYVLSSFVIILTRERELVALLLLSFRCLFTLYCKCSVALPHGAVGWSAVCDYGIT